MHYLHYPHKQEKTMKDNLESKFFDDDIDDLTIEQKIELRKKQFEVAMTGDCKMLIWLGKQYLDQKDKPELQMNVNELPTGFDLNVIEQVT